MKTTLLQFLFITTLAIGLSAQTTFDTAHIHTCLKFWKTGQLIPNTQLSLPTTVLETTPNADKSCWDIQYLPASIDPGIQNCYYLTRTFANDPLNGVTVADLIRISEHILGVNPLTGLGLRAADINRSNSVTTFDLIDLRKLTLGIYQDFPNNNSWNIYSNPDNLFSCNLLQPSPTTPFDTTSFLAVKTGDVDGDANPAGFYHVPGNTPHALRMPDWALTPQVEVWIPVYFTGPVEIKGLQFGLDFESDKLQIRELRTASGSAISQSSYGLFPNKLTFSLNTYADDLPGTLDENTAFVEILVRPLQAVQVSQVFQVSHQTTPGLTVDFLGNLHPIDSTLAFATTQTSYPDNARVFGQPSPNPFHESTRIAVEFEYPETAVIELFGADGKLISSQTGTIPAGKSHIEFNQESLQHRSLAFYRITGEGWSYGGKLVRN